METTHVQSKAATWQVEFVQLRYISDHELCPGGKACVLSLVARLVYGLGRVVDANGRSPMARHIDDIGAGAASQVERRTGQHIAARKCLGQFRWCYARIPSRVSQAVHEPVNNTIHL